MIRRERVGDILIRAGKLTEDQLNKALEEQHKTHKRVGDVLVDLGFIKEDELADTLASQLKMPRVHLADSTPNREAVDLLPFEFLSKNQVCPVKVMRREERTSMKSSWRCERRPSRREGP